MTARVLPASRSESNSPTQTIGSSPAASAAWSFLVDRRVGFAQDVPPLAVAENDVLAAEIAEHGGAQLAGEGPVLLVVHVLGAQGDLRAGNRPAHGVEIAAWRANGQIDAVERLGLFRHPFGQRHGRGPIRVHLPVAGNKRTSHQRNSSSLCVRTWQVAGRRIESLILARARGDVQGVAISRNRQSVSPRVANCQARRESPHHCGCSVLIDCHALGGKDSFPASRYRQRSAVSRVLFTPRNGRVHRGRQLRRPPQKCRVCQRQGNPRKRWHMREATYAFGRHIPPRVRLPLSWNLKQTYCSNSRHLHPLRTRRGRTAPCSLHGQEPQTEGIIKQSAPVMRRSRKERVLGFQWLGGEYTDYFCGFKERNARERIELILL